MKKSIIVKPKSIKLKVSISDKVALTSWLSPKFFQEEFENYKKRYFHKENKKDLIMAYILLQLYLENHFHYYIRFFVGGGFGLQLKNWREEDYVPKKLNEFKKFLSKNNFNFNIQDLKEIENYYTEIILIRNSLVHGHPIKETTEQGMKIQSDARKNLTRQRFNGVRYKANKIADLWNKLMSNLQEQEDLLKSSKLPNRHFFDNCKFQIF